MAGKKISIPDPQDQLKPLLAERTKYKAGEPGYPFYQIRNLKPTFAFDYLSMGGEQFCYNNNGLNSEDYVGLLNALKVYSSKSYKELRETPNYRFHPIDFDDPRVMKGVRKMFKNCLVPREDLLPDDQLPTLYQFDLNYQKLARACGFIFKGVFYLVWFDRNHEIYG